MKKQLQTAGITLFKVFIGAALAQVIASGTGVLDLTANGWKSVLGAGLGALVVTAYNWVSPSDARYGNGYAGETE